MGFAPESRPIGKLSALPRPPSSTFGDGFLWGRTGETKNEEGEKG